MGTAYIELKQYDEAINYLEKAVQLEPCNPEIRDNYGLAMIEKGMKNGDKELIRTSLAQYELVILLSPRDSKLSKGAINVIKNVRRMYLNE